MGESLMHNLSIVDVGHGNCAFITSDGKNVVIDAAARTHLLRYLETNGVTEIDVVVISHSDEDHIGGLINLLSNPGIKVKQLVINQDSTKGSALWADVRALVDGQLYQGKLTVWTGVYAGGQNQAWTNVTDRLALQILSPTLSMGLGGPGAPLPGGSKTVTSNTASIVIKVVFDGRAVALFTGDMDEIALSDIVRIGIEMDARCLVFPHHGGLPGQCDPEKFTQDILKLVNPDIVVFSNGRMRHSNPRKEIIDAIKKGRPSTYIACTQLSKACCSSAVASRGYTPKSYSAGVEIDGYCAGSFDIDLESCLAQEEQISAHRNFVNGLPEAMCQNIEGIIAKSSN
ncbi:MBL fold metallo-hydrolase [Pseudomonas aeruginosa]|nr:MBL fold metallo-hydrolase [Pseudomonas aeruginosa]